MNIKDLDVKVEELLQRTVTKFGGSAHIALPSKHLGKKAMVIIIENETDENDERKASDNEPEGSSIY